MPRQTEEQATELSLLDTVEAVAIIPGDRAQQKERDQFSESLLLAYLYSSSFRYLRWRLYTDRIRRFDQFIYGESDAAFLATFRIRRLAVCMLSLARRRCRWLPRTDMRPSFGYY
jgi:hypothetical protein